MKKRTLTIVICAVLMLSLAIAGTIAYITSISDEVKNVFTIGDVSITFAEGGTYEVDSSDSNIHHFEAMPGAFVEKDPVITVAANSKKAYVFVQAKDESNSNLTFTVDTAKWTKLSGTKNIYYLVASESTSAQDFHVFTKNTTEGKYGVTVASSVNGSTPDFSLSFKSAAVQYDNVASVAAAWDEVKSNFTGYADQT